MTYTKKETLQEFFIKKFLEENDINTKENIIIDHKKGSASLGEININIIFPNYICEYIKKLHNNKKNIKYFFQGIISNKRKWILNYNSGDSVILHSNYGRNPNKKYILDTNYYNNMSMSFFTLCPLGDCSWSYRFFEAIMCMSIPILEDNTTDIFAKNYFFYTKDSNHKYEKSLAFKNFENFMLEQNKEKKKIINYFK